MRMEREKFSRKCGDIQYNMMKDKFTLKIDVEGQKEKENILTEDLMKVSLYRTRNLRRHRDFYIVSNENPHTCFFDSKLGQRMANNSLKDTNKCNELDSISEASNSFEMVDYGLNPYTVEEMSSARRESCHCKQENDLVFKDGIFQDLPTEAFVDDPVTRMDRFYVETEVRYDIIINIKHFLI